MVSSSQISIILCIFFVHQSTLIFAKLAAAGPSPAATTSRPRATTTRRSSTTTRRTTAATSRRPPAAAGVDEGVTEAEMKQFTEELLRMDEDDVAHLVTIDTGCTTRCRRERENAVLVYSWF